MNVLIACEASQVVCKAFRKKGHNAFSCDITPCYGGFPEWHIQDDCLKILNGRTAFFTQDGQAHLDVLHKPWDMIIAHPPCTYLSKAGACKTFDFYGKIKNQERIDKGYQARDFFMKCLGADVEKLCVENPVPMKIFKLPMWSQIIQPYYFGDPYTKKTCLWLKGLPLLEPTNITDECLKSWTLLHSTQRLRSKTFTGIAEAMAEQWHENSKPKQISIFDIVP